MNRFSAGVVFGVLLTFAVLATCAVGAELPPAPKQDGDCTQIDHLPRVCPFRVYLTEEQLKAVQKLHDTNIKAMQKATQ